MVFFIITINPHTNAYIATFNCISYHKKNYFINYIFFFFCKKLKITSFIEMLTIVNDNLKSNKWTITEDEEL